MSTTLDLAGIIQQIVGLEDADNSLEKRKELYALILDKCNTYADVEALEKKGVLTLEGICDLLMYFDSVIDDYSGERKRFDCIVDGIHSASIAHSSKKHVLL